MQLYSHSYTQVQSKAQGRLYSLPIIIQSTLNMAISGIDCWWVLLTTTPKWWKTVPICPGLLTIKAQNKHELFWGFLCCTKYASHLPILHDSNSFDYHSCIGLMYALVRGQNHSDSKKITSICEGSEFTFYGTIGADSTDRCPRKGPAIAL